MKFKSLTILLFLALNIGTLSTSAADDHHVYLPIVMTANTNLCAGLVTDKADHPMTALAKPALGQTVRDPEFGTTIRRITAVGGTGVIKPLYSPMQAWNADETYMILYKVGHGHLLYTGKTYQYVRDLDISPPDIEQVYWSTVDPDILYWIGVNVLYRYHVSTNTSEPFRTINTCSGQVRADSHAWISWDSRYLGLSCDNTATAFIYDISAGTTLGSKPNGGNLPFISASGALAYWGEGG